jgi:PAS domain S-box-containing protein
MFAKEPQRLVKCRGKSIVKKIILGERFFSSRFTFERGAGLFVGIAAEIIREMPNKNEPLRILHLEDNPVDALLTKDQLQIKGVMADIKHVTGRMDFERALRAEKWDLVLSDFHVPNFTGLEALQLVRRDFPLTPFILMSGTIGEQAAIESLKAGATDYVLKQNRERLPAAVRRAVDEAKEHIRREQAEIDLRQSEKQYRLLFNGNPHPMWVFDLESLKILEVNEAAVEHYGFSHDEFLSMTLAELRVPGRNQPAESFALEAESRGIVWRHRRKDGREMDMEVVWRPMAFRGRLAALSMGTDATIRRQVAHHNAVFSKLSQQLSVVTEAAAAAMFICDAAEELFHWDNISLDLYSSERDEVVSLLAITTIDDKRVVIPPSPQPKSANALVRRVIARGAELVSAAEADDKPGTTMMAPIRRGELVVGVVFIQNRKAGSYAEHDLQTLQTLANQCSGALERVRAEEELRHSQRRFRELFESSPDAIFVEDLKGNAMDVNRSACKLLGMAREDIIGKNVIDDFSSGARRERKWSDFQLLASGKISSIESDSHRADGQLVPVEIRVAHIEFDREPALLFHVRDITERRAAETALRSSEILFRSVWENSVDGMRLADQNGIILAANQAFCRLAGLTHAQLEGKPFTVIYSANTDWEKLLQAHQESFRASQLQPQRVTEVTLHDGRSAVFEITDSFVESGGERRLMLTLFRDLTAQKKLEEQLRQSQKMEAIGQLAGGIAHDFNNILTVILGHASLLAMQPLDTRSSASAKQIKQASERAAGLTKQLLAFSRKSMAAPRLFDFNQLVSNMSEMLGRLLGEDISLQINFSGEPATIEADPGMMEQILMNLSVNSRDAMPRGGRLTIRVSAVEVDEIYSKRVVESRPGKFICLSHTDTGTGIPPENLARIFEPFFTTKELGKGTGLGLATVFGIVKQHQGWIEVESELGKGTTFNIFFPAAAGAAAVPLPSTEIQGRRRGGTENILVVEDERDLRDLVCRVLRNEGYRVFEAIDGHNALKIWDEYKNQISMLFTDVVMPGGLNGRDLAERIWAERPALKVIFSSGYGADTLGRDFKLDPKFNFLQKPYQPEKLAKSVRKCLDEGKI